MNLMKSLRNVALTALLLSAGVANAALYQFQITGDYSATWQMNSTVEPDAYGEDEGFLLEDVEGIFPGSIYDAADLIFYNAALGGGLQIYDWYGDTVLLLSDGLQLYTGSEANPLFSLGSFALTEFGGTGAYLLTVTDLDATPEPPVDVPEPATAALLLGGLSLLAASRKRRQAK